MTNKVQGDDIDWAVGLALETAALDSASKPASLQLGGIRPCTHPHALALMHDWRKAYAQTRRCMHICSRARMNTALRTAQHSQQSTHSKHVRAPRLRTPAVAFHVRRTPEHQEARNMQHGARYQVSTQSTPVTCARYQVHAPRFSRRGPRAVAGVQSGVVRAASAAAPCCPSAEPTLAAGDAQVAADDLT